MAARHSQIDYWRPGVVFPRSRVREPYPFRRRRSIVSLFSVVVPVIPVDRVDITHEYWGLSVLHNEAWSLAVIKSEQFQIATIRGERFGL